MEKGWIIQHRWNRRVVRSLTNRGQVRSATHFNTWAGILFTRPKVFRTRKEAQEAKKRFRDSANWEIRKVEKVSVWVGR